MTSVFDRVDARQANRIAAGVRARISADAHPEEVPVL